MRPLSRRYMAYEIVGMAQAMKCTVDPYVVAGIAMVESGGNPWAVRYEKEFRTGPPVICPFSCTQTTEDALRKFSFGLMQIMGQVARELGFDGWLTELLDPSTNIYWGCKYLDLLKGKFSGEIKDIVSAYNLGPSGVLKRPDGSYLNAKYVDGVFAYVEALTRDFG